MDENLDVIIDIPPHRQEIVVRDQSPDFYRVMKKIRLGNDGNFFVKNNVDGEYL